MQSDPGVAVLGVVGMQEPRQVPQVLAGVEEIDDLEGTGKVLLGEVPDPFGTVADDDLLLGAAPATVPGLEVKPLAELLGVLDGTGIGGGVGIANREAFVIPLGLREYAAKLGFARMSGQAVELTLAASGLLLHNRHAGAVHLHIEGGHGLADHDGQIELHGAVDLLLLALRDVRANGFGHALDRFGGYRQTGQQPQLIATLLKGSLLTDECLHAAHAGRERGVNNVELGVGGKLALLTMRTQIIGACGYDLAEYGENGLRAQLAIACQLAAPTGNRALLRHGEAQQLG